MIESKFKRMSAAVAHSLLKFSSDKEQTAQSLGQDNINKLSDSNVRNLLESAED